MIPAIVMWILGQDKRSASHLTAWMLVHPVVFRPIGMLECLPRLDQEFGRPVIGRTIRTSGLQASPLAAKRIRRPRHFSS